jgi:ubiquinone biosynthesis protein UbiJ
MIEMNQSESEQAVNPLMIPLLAAIEMAMNQLFAMDPVTFERLKRFRGKVVAFDITDIKQSLYFFPDEKGIQILSQYEGEADTIISGSLLSFAKMAIAEEKDKTRSVFQGDIKITGDIALGQRFQALFQQLDIDWEEHVSHITGDVIAHSLGNVARELLGWGRQVVNSIGMDVSEYIQYESRVIASGPEISHFNQQVDDIRSAVDRAEARLNRLEQMMATHKAAQD